MLTGIELKAKLSELGQTDEATAAIGCGYVSANGKARLAAFRLAQLQAHGLAPTKTKGGRGRALSFAVTANKAGAIMLASGYAALIGVEPGEQVQIAHQGGQLVITKAGVTPTATLAADTSTMAPIELPVVTYDDTPAPQLAVA